MLLAGSSLLTLLDDIATLLDDISVMGKLAAKKTACNQVNHLIPTRVLVKGGEITCKILK
ncbi:hypothetical protein E6R50_005216 [Escherichia coli]|nr:hypothetical protein [Escherichia coli]